MITIFNYLSNINVQEMYPFNTDYNYGLASRAFLYCENISPIRIKI